MGADGRSCTILPLLELITKVLGGLQGDLSTFLESGHIRVNGNDAGIGRTDTGVQGILRNLSGSTVNSTSYLDVMKANFFCVA